MQCEQCGYWWAECDEDGQTLTFPFCHFDGPDGWAPCEQDDYDIKYRYEYKEDYEPFDYGNDYYEGW